MRNRDQETWCQRALGPHYEFIHKFGYSGLCEVSMAQFILPHKKSSLNQFVDNSAEYFTYGREFIGIISTSNSFRPRSEWMVVQIHDCSNFEKNRRQIWNHEKVRLMTHIFVVPDYCMTEFVSQEKPNLSVNLLLEIAKIKNQQADPWTMVASFREYFLNEPPSVISHSWRCRKLLLRSSESWRQAMVLASAPSEIYAPIFNALEQTKTVTPDPLKKGFDKLKSSTLALVDVVDSNDMTAGHNDLSGVTGPKMRWTDDRSQSNDRVPFGFYRSKIPISLNTGTYSDFDKIRKGSQPYTDSLVGSRSWGHTGSSSRSRRNQSPPLFGLSEIGGEADQVSAATRKRDSPVIHSNKEREFPTRESKSYSEHGSVQLDYAREGSRFRRKAPLSSGRTKVDEYIPDKQNSMSTSSEIDCSVTTNRCQFYRGHSSGRELPTTVGANQSSFTSFKPTDIANEYSSRNNLLSRDPFQKRSSYGAMGNIRDLEPPNEDRFRNSSFRQRSKTNRFAQERDHRAYRYEVPQTANLLLNARDSRRHIRPNKVHQNPRCDVLKDPAAPSESDVIYVNFAQYQRIKHYRQKNVPLLRDLRHVPRAAYLLSEDEDEYNVSILEDVAGPVSTEKSSGSVEEIKEEVTSPLIRMISEEDQPFPDPFENESEEEFRKSMVNLSLIEVQGKDSFEISKHKDVQAPDTPPTDLLSVCSSSVKLASEVFCDSGFIKNSEPLLTPPRDSDSFSISSEICKEPFSHRDTKMDSAVEIPSPISSRDPYSPLPFDETPLFLTGFHKERIVFDVRSLSAVISSTLSQASDNILIIWLTDIDIDVASSVALFPEQCIICVKTLNFLANADVMAILSSAGIIYKGLPFVDSGGVGFKLTWVLSFGSNLLFPDSEHFVQSHCELEHLLMDHFITKGKNCTNIIRSSCEVHGLYDVILKELKGDIIVTNRRTK